MNKLIRKHWFRLPLFVAACISFASPAATIQFESADGLQITAETYIPNPPDSPIIVLFHQAGFSRGEYAQIAPRLNQLGFNAIAIDQRSGRAANGIVNKTAARAESAGLTTRYTDALPDMLAALNYAHQHFPGAKVIAWGSSYSAALVIKIAGDAPQLVDGVLAFSPGEYFARLGKNPDWIQQAARNIRVPVFITSARDEAHKWAEIFAVIDPALRHGFVPKTAGKHGSKALWKEQPDSSTYWERVEAYLGLFLELSRPKVT